VSEAEAADFLGISPRRLALLRRSGLAPFHIRAFGKAWYALADLIAFHKNYSYEPPARPPKTGSGGDG
jgi:hypothetical protein